MNTGLIWFDDSKSTMSEKARKALEYYQQKYGLPAHILETSLKDEPVPEGLKLVSRIQRVSIPKHHFLIGEVVEE